MNVVQEISRINARELEAGVWGGTGKSWHDEYSDSAWVHVGNLSYELSEGDVICVMSQWGEIEDINLIRDKDTNKSLGYAFIKYEDQRSTILAVDNFNGTELLGKTMRVDHVHQYKLPKSVKDRETERLKDDPDAQVSVGPGHAYRDKELQNEFDINKGVNVWAPPASAASAAASIVYKAPLIAAAPSSAEPETKKRKKESKKAEKKEKKAEKKEKRAEKKEKKEKKADGMPVVEVNIASAPRILPPSSSSSLLIRSDDALPSWRGNRDPAFQQR